MLRLRLDPLNSHNSAFGRNIIILWPPTVKIERKNKGLEDGDGVGTSWCVGIGDRERKRKRETT